MILVLLREENRLEEIEKYSPRSRCWPKCVISQFKVMPHLKQRYKIKYITVCCGEKQQQKTNREIVDLMLCSYYKLRCKMFC